MTKRTENLFASILAASIILLIGLGCFSGSGKTCTGELVYNGEKFNGIDKDMTKAKRNTCSKYCIEGDPEMDAMVLVWIDTLSVDERDKLSKGKKRNWDAQYKNKRIFEYVERCTEKCLKEKDVSVKCDK